MKLQKDISADEECLKALDVIVPYIAMADIDFKALLIDLKEKKDRGKVLTAEERFLLNHKIQMDVLRQEAAKREKMKSLVKDVDSTLRFPNDFVLTTDTVVWVSH